MSKYCIFDSNKICNNCGECEICLLYPNKKCNNCGKCLELEGYDVKAIKITDVIENTNNTDSTDSIETDLYEEKFDISYSEDFYTSQCDSDNSFDILDNDDMWEYIDDIENLNEILNDENLLDKLAHEKYPGFVVLNKRKG